jgi:hypothetical protein
MKTNILKISIGIILFLSIVLNFFLIKEDGSIVNRKIINNNIQGQSQGTVIINNGIIVSGEVEWDMVSSTFDKIPEVLSSIGASSVISYIIKPSIFRDEYYIIYLPVSGSFEYKELPSKRR